MRTLMVARITLFSFFFFFEVTSITPHASLKKKKKGILTMTGAVVAQKMGLLLMDVSSTPLNTVHVVCE